jgi:predicted Co/Zn/Cd cation transporter (cation efflux family)
MSLAHQLAVALLSFSACAAVVWAADRARKRREDLAAANAIMDSWRVRHYYDKRDRYGRFSL